MQLINCITTYNNKYYAGMTIDNAKNKKQFSKIDLNNDNILSADEILKNRNTDAFASKWAGIASMGIAAAGMIFMRFGILGAFLFGTGALMFQESRNIDKTTENYKMLSNMLEEKNKL